MPKRRTRRKRGGKCEYKKINGKWKNVCQETKKNFSIKKTSLSGSKKGYGERKRKKEEKEEEKMDILEKKEVQKNKAKVDKLEKDCHIKMKEMGKKMTRNLLLKDSEIKELKDKIKELEKMEKKGYTIEAPKASKCVTTKEGVLAGKSKYYVDEFGFCNELGKYNLSKTRFDLDPATCCKTKDLERERLMSYGGKRRKRTRRRRRRTRKTKRR